MTWLSGLLDFITEVLGSSVLSQSVQNAEQALRAAATAEDYEIARQECAAIERAILLSYFHF